MKAGERESVGVGVDGKDGGCGASGGREVDRRRGSLVAVGSGEEGAGKGDSG